MVDSNGLHHCRLRIEKELTQQTEIILRQLENEVNPVRIANLNRHKYVLEAGLADINVRLCGETKFYNGLNSLLINEYFISRTGLGLRTMNPLQSK